MPAPDGLVGDLAEHYLVDKIYGVAYTAGVSWEVEYTEEFGAWWDDLSVNQQERLTGAIEKLQETGPGLGRPYVDTLTNTKLGNLKELRAATEGSHLRVLFAFDPRRAAILLLGGDKTGRWEAWYRKAIPQAERLYDEHLDELRKEGLI